MLSQYNAGALRLQFLCNSETVSQLMVLCPAEKPQINSYSPPVTLKCWQQIKTLATVSKIFRCLHFRCFVTFKIFVNIY